MKSFTVELSTRNHKDAPAVKTLLNIDLSGATDEQIQTLVTEAVKVRWQAKYRRADKDTEQYPTIPPTATFTVTDLTERASSDPLKKYRELFAQFKGIKASDVTDEQATTFRALIGEVAQEVE